MKRSTLMRLMIIPISLLVGISLYSCSGSSGGSGNEGNGSSYSSVALYVTDDLSDYKEVKATINKVQLLKTSSGESCDLLSSTSTFDITDLAGVIQLLDTASCPAVNYNRLSMEFDQSVTITNADNSITQSCSFTSYKDSSSNQPNVLQCLGNICTLEINGAINILSGTNKLALDFDLKEFEVEHLGSPNCSVTLKVSPLNSSEMDDKKESEYAKEAVTGAIFGLNTSLNTFTIQRGNNSFNVDYSVATGELTGAQGVPPTGSAGRGSADLNVDYSARQISGILTFSNLSSVATEAHIHMGQVGVNGLTVVDLSGGEGVKSGTFNIPLTTLTADQFSYLRKDLLYFNIHSESYPDGEIRGQIIYPVQYKIDRLLQSASDNGLKVRAFCVNDLSETNSCTASALFVKLEGTVSDHDSTNHLFTLTFSGGSQVTIDYTQAFLEDEVEGVIADSKKVEVKLFGIDASGNYLAQEVEHEDDDDEDDDHDDDD